MSLAERYKGIFRHISLPENPVNSTDVSASAVRLSRQAFTIPKPEAIQRRDD